MCLPHCGFRIGAPTMFPRASPFGGDGRKKSAFLAHVGTCEGQPSPQVVRFFCVKPLVHAYDTLILEGGSLRCAFTAGVMDALMLLGPMRFQRTLGVSAGAMVMASYLAGQHKYFIRVARELLGEGEFIRFSAAFSDEGVMNLAHLKRHVMVHAPLDMNALEEAQRTTQAWVVMTHAETGKAMYVQPHANTWLNALVASATLPMWTRGQVKWEEDWVFDGGYSDPLPGAKHWNSGRSASWSCEPGLPETISRKAPRIIWLLGGFKTDLGSTSCSRKGMWPTTTRSTVCLQVGTSMGANGKKLRRLCP